MSYLLQIPLADKLYSLNRGTGFLMQLDCISNSFYAQSQRLSLDPPYSISLLSNYSQASWLDAAACEGPHIILPIGFRADEVYRCCFYEV